MFNKILSQCWTNYQSMSNDCCQCEQYQIYQRCNCSFCLSKDFHKRPDEYECDKKMLFYVLNYGAAYISEIYHYLTTSGILTGYTGRINILSLGCGFCPDHFAFAKYIADKSLDIELHYTGVDKSTAWDKTRMPLPNVNYQQGDFTDLTRLWPFNGFQIITVNKVFSTIRKHGASSDFLTNIQGAVKNSMAKVLFLFLVM